MVLTEQQQQESGEMHDGKKSEREIKLMNSNFVAIYFYVCVFESRMPKAQ